jgi:hypothetical protein
MVPAGTRPGKLANSEGAVAADGLSSSSARRSSSVLSNAMLDPI